MSSTVNKTTIGHVGIYVTEHCPLRCRDCNAGVPYNKHPCHYSVDELSTWIEKTFELIGWVEHVDFIGGEPLVHPEMTVLCKELHKYKNKFSEMRILTSSTVMPSDKLLEYIRTIIDNGFKFLFYLDNYGEELSKCFGKIKDKLNDYNIPYRITDYSGKTPAYGGWVDYRMYDLPEHKGYDAGQLSEVFSQCFYYKSGGSLVLRNGSVYPCVFPLTREILGQRKAPPEEKIDLCDDTVSVEQKKALALSFRERKTPYKACEFCPGLWEGAPRVPPAVQL